MKNLNPLYEAKTTTELIKKGFMNAQNAINDAVKNRVANVSSVVNARNAVKELLPMADNRPAQQLVQGKFKNSDIAQNLSRKRARAKVDRKLLSQHIWDKWKSNPARQAQLTAQRTADAELERKAAQTMRDREALKGTGIQQSVIDAQYPIPKRTEFGLRRSTPYSRVSGMAFSPHKAGDPMHYPAKEAAVKQGMVSWGQSSDPRITRGVNQIVPPEPVAAPATPSAPKKTGGFWSGFFGTK